MDTEHEPRMAKLDSGHTWAFKFNAFGDKPAFIGISRYDNLNGKTVVKGIIFDKKIGRLRLPRRIYDETSDWEFTQK